VTCTEHLALAVDRTGWSRRQFSARFRCLLAAEAQRSRAANNERESASAVPPDVGRWLASPLAWSFSLGLRPWFGLRPTVQVVRKKVLGRSPEPRAQPRLRSALTARHSHRLTSSGEAVTKKLLKKHELKNLLRSVGLWSLLI